MPSTNNSPNTARVLGPSLPDTFTDNVDHIAAAWYVYTAQAGDAAISFFPFGVVGFSNVTVYATLAAALAEFPNYLNISANANLPIWFPVTPGVSYFVKGIADAGNTLSIDIRVQRVPNGNAPPGTIVVPDSTNGLPVTFLDIATGQLIRTHQPYADGEVSQVLNDGTSLSEQSIGRLVKIYDPQFNQLVSTSLPGWTNGHLSGGTNKIDTFYLSSTFQATVRTMNAAGAIGGTSWTMSGNVFLLQPSPDESILYWVQTGQTTVKRFDLVNNIALTDLATIPGGMVFILPDLIVLDDGRIIAGWDNNAGAQQVNIYNPDGSIDVSIPLTYPKGRVSSHRMARWLDDSAFVFWVHAPTGNAASHFVLISTTDGSIISTSPDVATFISMAYMGPATATPIADYGIADSCAFFVSRVAITTTARLVVTKETIPGGSATVFPFTATGGLSPGSFSLADGDTQEFNDIAPGTYGVEEGMPPSGWTLTGVTVSNGDPNTAINVEAGDDILVTFTNTLTGDECPALVTHARQDGLPYRSPFD